MNARLTRRFGMVLAAFTVAGCAMQPDANELIGQTSIRPEGISTIHTRTTEAAGQPSLRQSLAAMANPSLAGIACERTAPGQVNTCAAPDPKPSVAAQLASAAPAMTDDAKQLATDDAQQLAAADAHDGSLAHAAPLSVNTPDVSDFHQEGRASWYGDGFHGRRTASGERYDMNELTAAHPSLPLLSYVRVTNLLNHRSVVVKINDRGPFHVHRILDLSMAAARLLGMQHRGTGRVSITGLSPQEAQTALSGSMLASR